MGIRPHLHMSDALYKPLSERDTSVGSLSYERCLRPLTSSKHGTLFVGLCIDFHVSSWPKKSIPGSLRSRVDGGSHPRIRQWGYEHASDLRIATAMAKARQSCDEKGVNTTPLYSF